MIKLNVFWGRQRVGQILSPDHAKIIFQYAPDYLTSDKARPISLTLPLTSAPYPDEKSHPFFANLLPEGDLRHLITALKHISEHNDVILLRELGAECAGALSIVPEDKLPQSSQSYIPLSADDLERMIEESRSKPLLVSRENLHLSLAGAQDKLPVYVQDNAFYLTAPQAPSSHILKPAHRLFPESVMNEYFCMTLASRLGLPVPAVSIWKGKHHQALLVQRFDRIRLASGEMERFHQEDFCQALGYSSQVKYEAEGGPGFKQCFDLLKDVSLQPLIDRKHLFEWLIFNVLMGNTDAHAKNISLLLMNQGYRLAPFYDLMTTLVYPNLTKNLAMRIGGEKRVKWVRKRHFVKLAEQVGIKGSYALAALESMAARLTQASQSLKEELAHHYGASPVISAIVESCLEQIKTID